MKNRFILTFFLIVVLFVDIFAQERHGMGANFNMETIAKTPRKVQLSFQSFRGMTEQASLEQYCPTPGDQGNHGTCIALANGYRIKQKSIALVAGSTGTPWMAASGNLQYPASYGFGYDFPVEKIDQ